MCVRKDSSLPYQQQQDWRGLAIGLISMGELIISVYTTQLSSILGQVEADFDRIIQIHSDIKNLVPSCHPDRRFPRQGLI